ncbi:MAG: LamG domain-containing protein [Candidatus Anstonellales archaeon]
MGFALIRLTYKFLHNFKKGQTAFEYFGSMIILSFVIVFMAYFAYTILNDSVAIFHINNSLEKLSRGIDELSNMAPNSFIDVYITLPYGYNASSSYIGSLNGSKGKSIQISYKQSNAFRLFSIDVYGKLPSIPGTYLMRLFKTDENRIRIDTYDNLNGISSVLTDHGLIAYWAFDNNTLDYTTRFDANISGNVNCSNMTIGVIDKACNFSGSNSYLSVPLSIRDFTNPLVNNLTIAFWYMPLQLESSSWDEVILGGYTYHWFVSIPSNVPTAYIYNSAGTLFNCSSNFEMALKKWYHISVIYLSNRTMEIYVNSLKRNSTTWTGSFTVAQNYFRIGGRGSNYVKGIIDDLRIYNRSLNKFEIEDLYYSGYAGN